MSSLFKETVNSFSTQIVQTLIHSPFYVFQSHVACMQTKHVQRCQHHIKVEKAWYMLFLRPFGPFCPHHQLLKLLIRHERFVFNLYRTKVTFAVTQVKV
jgi:hypothetical protein